MDIKHLLTTAILALALFGICSGTSSPHSNTDFPRLEVVRNPAPDEDSKRTAFWNEFEIHGRFALASEVALSLGFPDEAIPEKNDSVVLIGYYMIPEKPPFGYFEFHFEVEVDGIRFAPGSVSLSGMTFAPKRLPFCIQILPPSYLGPPVQLKELRTLLNKKMKLKLTSGFTK